jgi:uncharacterized protein YkwD
MKQNKRTGIICILIIFALAMVLPGAAAAAGSPDIAALSVTGPGSAVAGKSVSLSMSLKNIGTASAGSFSVYFYLSKDTTVTSGDIYLGRETVSSLRPGSQQKISFSGTIPAATTPGTYNFGAMADGSSRVAESNEKNNAVAAAGTVTVTGPSRPDLVITTVSAPGTCSPGGKVSVPATVRNAGPAGASSSYVSFYLSTDTALDAQDAYLGRTSVPSLSSGAERSVTASLGIPSGTREGSYVVCAVADGTKVVTEGNEENNAGFSGLFKVVTVPVPGGSFTAQVESAILTYVNQERVNAGVKPLSTSAALTSAARAHSLDMAERNFFSHTNPDGLTPWQRMVNAGYSYSYAAENIASQSYYDLADTPDEVGRYFVKEMWMKSSGHRANILNSALKETGIGVAYEPDRSSNPYGFIATEDFGTPR